MTQRLEGWGESRVTIQTLYRGWGGNCVAIGAAWVWCIVIGAETRQARGPSRDTMNYIVTEGSWASEWVTIQSLYHDRRVWAGRWGTCVTIQYCIVTRESLVMGVSRYN